MTAQLEPAARRPTEKGRAANTPATAAAATRTRKLHLGHFAFMRSVVQGLDTRGSWERYLRLEGEHDDIRHVHRTIQWIRDEFAAAAKRHDRFGTARLVRMDASRIADKATVIPTLEEFAEEYGLSDFSEAEQLDAYHERFGARTSKESRRARLIAKQLDALAWLESLHTQTHPKATDAIASWLHPDLTDRLEAAGIETINDLVDRINGLGMRWWAGIPAIGVTKAQRITDWLRANASSTGLILGRHVSVKRSTLNATNLAGVVPRATAIVPLEKLVLPPDLSGAHGCNRVPHHLCRIPAQNDVEAIFAWIQEKDTSSRRIATNQQHAEPMYSTSASSKQSVVLSHTQRAYRKEGERFLLWAIVQQRKPLSSISEDDCYAYLAFLADPVPARRWCAPRARERWSPLWRPFEGPLSPAARRQAVTILKNLFGFLVKHYYIGSNPWEAVPLPRKEEQCALQSAAMSQECSSIPRKLDRLPDTSVGRRLRFVAHLMSATGLRLSEIVNLRVDDLVSPRDRQVTADWRGKEKQDWHLTIAGKGGEQRIVSLELDMIDELSQYLVSRGLEPDPLHPANVGTYLVGKAGDIVVRAPWAPRQLQAVDPKAGISAGVLAKDFRRYFNTSAAAFRSGNAPGRT